MILLPQFMILGLIIMCISGIEKYAQAMDFVYFYENGKPQTIMLEIKYYQSKMIIHHLWLLNVVILFKYTGTWIGNGSRIMYTIYYTRMNRRDGYINPLTYIIIYFLSPSSSPSATFKKTYFQKAELKSTQFENKKIRRRAWGLKSLVSYLSGHIDTHAVFMPIMDLTDRYSNWVITKLVTHSTGDCTNMFRMKLVCIFLTINQAAQRSARGSEGGEMNTMLTMGVGVLTN